MKNKQKEKAQTTVKPFVDSPKIEAYSGKNNDGGYLWLV
jgi:hypothetical protein